MNKKIIAAVLAGACAVSAMSITASANKAVTAAGEVKLAASAVLATPAIDVSVPTTVAAVINPYGVPVEVKGITYGQEGLTSPLYTIVNKTKTSNILVTASASLTVPVEADTTKVGNNGATKGTKSAIEVVSEASKAVASKKTTSTKSIYAYVVGSASSGQIKAVAEADVTGTGDEGAKTEDDLKAVNATKVTAKGVTTYTIDVTKLDPMLTAPVAEEEGEDPGLLEAQEDQVVGKVVFTDTTATKNGDGAADNTTKPGSGTLLVLAKAQGPQDSDAADAAYFTYGQFQIGGKIYSDATKNVTWTAADKITVNLVLNLAPTNLAPSAVES